MSVEPNAVREEIETLDKLTQGVSSQFEARAEKLPVVGSDVDLALRVLNHNIRKGYEELAHHVYGRTIAGREINEDGTPSSAFTFRITQANLSFLENGCGVIARNSPVASALITAQPGDEREVSAPNRDRYFDVSEVRMFDGPSPLLSPLGPPDFKTMAVRRLGMKKPVVVENLRAAAISNARVPQHLDPERQVAPSPPVIARAPARPTGPGKPKLEIDSDQTWLRDWTGIFLGTTETLSLGHQFFTRTTPDQERALTSLVA